MKFHLPLIDVYQAMLSISGTNPHAPACTQTPLTLSNNAKKKWGPGGGGVLSQHNTRVLHSTEITEMKGKNMAIGVTIVFRAEAVYLRSERTKIAIRRYKAVLFKMGMSMCIEGMHRMAKH